VTHGARFKQGAPVGFFLSSERWPRTVGRAPRHRALPRKGVALRCRSVEPVGLHRGCRIESASDNATLGLVPFRPISTRARHGMMHTAARE
jgi:hypothetical protein